MSALHHARALCNALREQVEVGEHTCGGYGPESNYMHEPGCGFEPILDLSKMEGWPGAERDRLAEAVRAYGRTIDRWGLLIIAATRSEDITTSGGDGDWEVIESRLAEVPALLTERDALAAKVARVRLLHELCECNSGNPHCRACETMTYPCPTARALDEEPQP